MLTAFLHSIVNISGGSVCTFSYSLLVSLCFVFLFRFVVSPRRFIENISEQQAFNLIRLHHQWVTNLQSYDVEKALKNPRQQNLVGPTLVLVGKVGVGTPTSTRRRNDVGKKSKNCQISVALRVLVQRCADVGHFSGVIRQTSK